MANFVIDWEKKAIATYVSGNSYSLNDYVKHIVSGEQYHRVFKANAAVSPGQAPPHANWTDKTDAAASEYGDVVGDQLYPSFGGLNVPHTPRILEVVFGDGYTQVQPDGINRYTDAFALNFEKISGTNAKSIQIWAEANEAVTKFQMWMPDPISAYWDLRLISWSQRWVEWNSFNTTLNVKRAYGYF